MENDELNDIINELLVQNALNITHINALRETVFEMGRHLLEDSEAANLQRGYYDILSEKSELLSGLEGMVPAKRIQKALFDLHEHVSYKLREIS